MSELQRLLQSLATSSGDGGVTVRLRQPVLHMLAAEDVASVSITRGTMPAIGPNDPQDAYALLQRAKQTPTKDQQLLIDQALEKVINSHMETCIYTAERRAEGMRKFREIQRDDPVSKLVCSDFFQLESHRNFGNVYLKMLQK